MIYESKLILAVSIFSFLINLILISFCNLEAATVKFDHVMMETSLASDQFLHVEEGAFDPRGTYVLKSANDEFIKVRSEDLKAMTDKEIEKLYQKKIIQFSLLFQDRVSPYKGAITTNSECFDKSNAKKIVKNEKLWLVTFNTVATKNFAYGKCDGEGKMYFSRYQILFCKKAKKIFDVRYFTHDKNKLSGFEAKCLDM